MTLDAPRLRLIALLLAVAAVVVVAVLLIGGGGESSEEAADEAANEFVTAFEEGDFEAACGMLTDGLRSQIGGDQCPDQLAATAGQVGEGFAIEVVDVRVSGPKAVADTEVRGPQGAPSESSFELQLSGETWQISGLGG